jgi:UDP-2,3-diacylglucosamine pyrophosphatase LpxH
MVNGKKASSGSEAKSKKEKEKVKKLDSETKEYFGLIYENQREINRMLGSLKQIENESREFFMDAVDGNSVTIGVASNTHCGNMAYNEEALGSFVDFAYDNGADMMLNAGDMLDGTGLYRNQKYEQYATTIDDQIKNLSATYPRKRGMKTYFVCGDHDLSFRGKQSVSYGDFDVGEKIEDARSDFVFLGDNIAPINFPLNGGEDNMKCLILHPNGNPAYAISYKPQKTIEALTGGEKPDMILIGQYHVAEHMPNYRNTESFQTGCFQDQTSLMKARYAPAHIGGWLLEYKLKDREGKKTGEIVSTFKAFYSKGREKNGGLEKIVELKKDVSNLSKKIRKLSDVQKENGKDMNLGELRKIKSNQTKIFSYQHNLMEELNESIIDFSSRKDVKYVNPVPGNEVIYGAIGDSHFGHECDSKEYHDDTYELFDKVGVKKVFHAGDVLDGHGMHAGQEFEQYASGFKDQLKTMAEKYPRVPGIETDFICGNHDLSFKKRNGIDVGPLIEMVRPDLHHIGDGVGECVFVLKNGRKVKIRLEHPSGGTAYALSYRPQKIAESLGDKDKPNTILIGHYHKSDRLPHYRNINTIQVGCLQDQTPFMKSKAIAANTGAWVIKDSYGEMTNEFKAFYIPFDKNQAYDIDSYIDQAKEAIA